MDHYFQASVDLISLQSGWDGIIYFKWRTIRGVRKF